MRGPVRPERSGAPAPPTTRRVHLAVIVVVALVLTAIAWRAHGATFTVNSAADTTDGTCGPLAGGCTLREAIEAVVATPGHDTIRFDPAVFPPPGLTVITLTSPLPIIADAAGTAIDGGGARFSIAGALAQGLVFASAPGAPLANVMVTNFSAFSFTGTAIHICGGAPPDCAEDVSGAVVRNVTVGFNDGDGIRIAGRVVKKAQVVDSVVFRAGGCGIRFFADESLVGPRVQGASAIDSGDCGGILMKATGAIVGATVVDSLAVRGDGVGIAISGQDVIKPKISHVVASGNAGTGLLVHADRDGAGAKLSDLLVVGNGSTGLELASDTGTTAGVKLERVAADGNALQGIELSGRTVGAKITRTAVVGNTSHGIDATSGMTSVGIDAAKISDVVAAGNDDGFILRAGASVLQKIHAGANTGTGITLFEGDGGNTVEKNSTCANGRNGITLIDSLGNVVRDNVALGNGSADLRDDTFGCDANIWTANLFGFGSDPCVH